MKNLRDAGLALSLANLLFYPIWAELLPGCYGHYYLKNPPGVNFNLGILLVVFGTALLLWLGIQLVRFANHPFLRALGTGVFLIVFLFSFNEVRYHVLRFAPIIPFNQQALFEKLDLVILRPILVLSALLMLTKWRGRVVRTVKTLTLILLPFAVVTFSQTAWASIKLETGIPFREFQDQPPAPLLPVKPGLPRVLWFLFDGCDQRLTFDERLPGLELPHLDRLRQEAFYASDAHSPAMNTRESLPALLTGIQNAYVRPVGANDLLIRHDNTGILELWSQQPNVFSKARALGCNTALIGYYHPYSRVIGRHLTKCIWTTGYWDPLGMNEPSMTLPKAISRILAREIDRLLVSIPYAWRIGLSRPSENPSEFGTRSVPAHVKDYLHVRKETQTLLRDPTYPLIFVHWPVPHAPFIYDRRTGAFCPDRQTSYSDNLVLVDKTLGEIRASLEEASLWDSTALVITSDHAWERRDVGAVPFLLKLPGQKKGITYSKRFNTVVMSNLLLDLLSGKVSHPQDVASWLDQHHDTTG